MLKIQSQEHFFPLIILRADTNAKLTSLNKAELRKGKPLVSEIKGE